MKLLFALVVIIVSVLFIVKGNSNYSPMDSYVNAQVKEAKDSTRHANNLHHYLDSLYSSNK